MVTTFFLETQPISQKLVLIIYRYFFYKLSQINLGEDPVACYQDTFGQVVCEQLD